MRAKPSGGLYSAFPKKSHTKTVFSNGPVHFASVDPANIPCKPSGSIGCNTAEVLADLGYSEDEIKAMYEAKEVM